MPLQMKQHLHHAQICPMTQMRGKRMTHRMRRNQARRCPPTTRWFLITCQNICRVILPWPRMVTNSSSARASAQHRDARRVKPLWRAYRLARLRKKCGTKTGFICPLPVTLAKPHGESSRSDSQIQAHGEPHQLGHAQTTGFYLNQLQHCAVAQLDQIQLHPGRRQQAIHLRLIDRFSAVASCRGFS